MKDNLKMKESKDEFLERLIGFSIGPIVGAFILFIKEFLQTWLVPPEQFGKVAMYVMALQISTIFLYLSFDQAYVREYNAEKNNPSFLLSSTIVPLLFSLIVMFIFLGFQNEISFLLFNSYERFVIQMLAFSLPVKVVYRFNTLMIRMDEKAKYYSIIQITEKIIDLTLLLLIMLSRNQRDFKGIILADFFAVVIISAITLFGNRQAWIKSKEIDLKLLKRMFIYGIPLIPASLMMWLLGSISKISLRIIGGFESVGLFSAAFKIVGILSIVQISFSTFWAPTAFRWYENKEPIKKFEIVSDKLNSLLALLFAIVVLFKDQIIYFLSPDYRSSAELVPFLLFSPIMYILAETTKMGINFTRKTYYMVLVIGVATIVNIVGCVLLIPRVGSVGASISTGIAYISYFLIATFISSKIWKKINIKKQIITIIIMVLMASFSLKFDNMLVDSLFLLIILIYHWKNIIWGISTIMDFLNKKLLRKFKSKY